MTDTDTYPSTQLCRRLFDINHYLGRGLAVLARAETAAIKSSIRGRAVPLCQAQCDIMAAKHMIDKLFLDIQLGDVIVTRHTPQPPAERKEE